MSYTTAQLSTAVLRHLGILDATETADADDVTYITGVWLAKWEELSGPGMEITYFPYDDIPNPVFLVIRDLVANETKSAFGLQSSVSDKEAEEVVILRRLRRHMAQPATGLPGQAAYF